MNIVETLPDGTEITVWFAYLFHARVAIGGLMAETTGKWLIDHPGKNMINGCRVKGGEIVPK